MSAAAPFEPGPIHRFLADDHVRLDHLLQRAVANRGEIDGTAYGEFRAGLLRHIGMEEKILLPAAQRAQGGVALPIAARIRLEHGALAALLVPTPSPTIVRALYAILVRHNALEEGPEGLYATCDRLLADEAPTLVAALRAAPPVSVSPHAHGPGVIEATRRALQRAGYDLEER